MVTSRVVLGVAIVLTAACGSSTRTSSTAPSQNSRSGVWTGTASDAVNGSGALRLVLEDRPVSTTESFLTGTWTMTYGDPSKNASGVVSGGLAGTTGFFNLAPLTPPTCAVAPPFPAAVGSYIASRLSINASSIRGDYVLGTCTGSVMGALEVRR